MLSCKGFQPYIFFRWHFWGCWPLLVLFFLSNNGCRQVKPTVVLPAFYYWKQTFALNSNERQLLTDVGIQTLYIKVFDVVIEKGKPMPVATLQFESSVPIELQWVPVVYITNQTFEKSTLPEAEDLAQKVAQKIRDVAAASGNTAGIREIQIDCDWTQQTRDSYFHFLAQLHQQFQPDKLPISATLRLHQIKYRQKTGIPPADKGLLMYYNMGELRSWKTQNSILDNAQGRQYIYKKSDYPIPLDVALPIFSWGLLFRKQQFSGIFNGLHSSIADSLAYLQKTADRRYAVLEDTFYSQTKLKKGDRLRIEQITKNDLLTAADVCRPLTSRTDTLQVILFHLDDQFTNRFTHKDWKDVFESFR